MIQARVEKKDPEAIIFLGENTSMESLDCKRTCERQSNCGQRLQSLVRLKHSTTLDCVLPWGWGSRGQGKGCRVLQKGGHARTC